VAGEEKLAMMYGKPFFPHVGWRAFFLFSHFSEAQFFPRKHIGKLHIKIIGFLFARQMYATEQRQ
jgi:hypothetical protein